MPTVYKFGTIRSFNRVILLSLCTFGIYYLLYQWWLFEDLQEHYKEAQKVEPNAVPTRNNPTTMFIFVLLFAPYAIYTKYHLLHEHIATSRVETVRNCAPALQALIMIWFFSICTLGIYSIILEYRWQKAFNAHILAHEDYQ
jgi:arginine exporter protein ArgO